VGVLVVGALVVGALAHGGGGTDWAVAVAARARSAAAVAPGTAVRIVEDLPG
jgi:hypothetical protein